MKNAVPRMGTIREVAEIFNLSEYFVRRLCLEQRIVFVKTGNKYLINIRQFTKFLNAGTQLERTNDEQFE